MPRQSLQRRTCDRSARETMQLLRCGISARKRCSTRRHVARQPNNRWLCAHAPISGTPHAGPGRTTRSPSRLRPAVLPATPGVGRADPP
ncbi:hypothetical protein BRM22_12765 [Xanthomonas oryzae pv. oryzae]|nr:hypothetical protein B9W05_22280 [Xanthomonas oryzae pv. oryzae]AXI16466.1 hypothetical protein CDO19_03730 [Xanthomonas oryzae pv. oryzae]AXI20426.1 hypothetical protein CDO11_03730 [Xanthomonas oryzae pv. oryzae]AXM08664.1 hypothetical protein BRM60_03740 [Xanthomonas oryzae pv. oryzae]AXM12452.1 hypothetical protein BRN32_03745 [Xanthomonas oryzae pv. oryzae]